jgi:guanyl-specific ribonuclease Sa
MPQQFIPSTQGKSGRWLRLVVVVVALAIGWYGAWNQQQSRPHFPKPTPALAKATSPSPTAGDVDIGSTLGRIRRGERLHFSHDGSTFENRERRLPQRPAGYYKEYVHPTPGVDGPGPQRIVAGKQGEIYYTPDHYRTFQRMDRP